MKHVKTLSLLFVLLGSATSVAAQTWTPPAVYLTWQQDPTTTMTIHWHAGADRPDSQVTYRRADVIGVVGQTTVNGTSKPMRHCDRIIHTVELTGLEPDTVYVFRIGNDSGEFRFRTMPATLDRPIRFVATGDVMRDRELFAHMNNIAAKLDPDFVILGGDIAHDNGVPEGAANWHTFLDIWQRTMVAPDGRLIPMIGTIGNHETPNGGYDQDPADIPFFYDMLAFPGTRGYGALDFGKYLSIIVLDTKHSHPLEGAQTEYLDKALAQRKDQMHVSCVYHVPAWPGSRNPINAQNRRVRNQWVPIFEKHNVDFCFEHHDHTMKRTHPIRNGEVDPLGVVYFGDGGYALGETRRPKPPGSWWNGGRWYLAHSAQTNFFWFVTIDGKTRTFEAIDPTARVFHTYATVDGMRAMVTRVAGQGKLPLHLKIGGWVLGVLIAIGLLKLLMGVCCKKKPAGDSASA